MLISELYDGQGFGNQLWSYVFTRVLSSDKNLQFGIQCPEKFKGRGFLDLDMGQQVVGGSGPEGGPPTELPDGINYYYSERVILHPKRDVDIRVLDSGFQEVVDNTKIEGIFQAEDYIAHRKEDIRGWLRYEPKQLDIDFSDPDICVINFRGGEYKGNPKIFLRRKYWIDAVAHIESINPNVKFVVITDDPPAARRFFPRYSIRHYGIHGDYQAINTASYLIVSNSSFAFFPAWLNRRAKICVAPKYWAAHNESDGYWSCSYNITRNWLYLDREGECSSGEQCISELSDYQDLHTHMYAQKKIDDSIVVVSSYSHDLSWLPRYTNDYFVYERGTGSGLPPQLNRAKVRFVSNNGSNFKDYFNFIVENYESLPDVVYLIKGNVFPRHVRQHVFDASLSHKVPHSIIDKKKHRTTFPLDFFGRDGMYYELNSDWFVHTGAPWRYFNSVDSFLAHFDKSHKHKMYTRFSIGAQYVVSRETIRQIPKHVYQDLCEIVSHGGEPIGYTAECYIVERSMDRLWQNPPGVLLDVERKLHQLNMVSNTELRKSILFKTELALLDLSAQLINNTSSLVLKVLSASCNRYRLIRNFYGGGASKW